MGVADANSTDTSSLKSREGDMVHLVSRGGVEELARIIASSAVRGMKAHAQRDRTQQARRSRRRPPSTRETCTAPRCGKAARLCGAANAAVLRRGTTFRDREWALPCAGNWNYRVPALLRCYHAHFAVASSSPFASKSSRCGEQKIRLAAERLKFIFQSKPLECCFESESVCK
jgi:hypothetical protein